MPLPPVSNLEWTPNPDGTVTGSWEADADQYVDGYSVVVDGEPPYVTKETSTNPLPGGVPHTVAVTPVENPAAAASASYHPAPVLFVSGSAYNDYDNPQAVIALAKEAGLTHIELVNFQKQQRVLADAMGEDTWTRLDAFIAAIGAAGLHMILNLSEYGWDRVEAAKTNPAVAVLDQPSWDTYIDFVANRVNTVSHVRYGNDSTITLVKLWGEIPPPKTLGVTAEVMLAWHSATMAHWAADSKTPICSGGFSFLNEPDAAGIPWQEVYADPNNALCAFEINSYDDWIVTVPLVVAFARKIGKRWYLAACSACLGNPDPTFPDCNHYPTDTGRAQHVTDMCDLAAGKATTPHPNIVIQAAEPACGLSFWNLGQAGTGCDLGPGAPASWAALKAGVVELRA